MADITYDEWMRDTKKTRFEWRSSELKKVDKAFKVYSEATGSGAKTNALQELARVFRLWVRDKGGDDLVLGDALNSVRNRNVDEHGQGPVERLQSLIRGTKISNVAIVRDLNAEVPDRLVMDASLQGRFDSAKVRETYERSKLAVHDARDLLLQAGRAGTNGRAVYERWFGAYSEANLRTVKANVKNLCDLFDVGVIIMKDARTLVGAWGDCYGFAMPGNKQNYVEFTVGRAFFDKQGWAKVPGQTVAERSEAVALALSKAYGNTSDWTVGTMIHELGHAANALPDVDFQAPSTYQVSPGGLTPMGWEQCSTPALDQALALADAGLAVQNTDSYGQFCREALQANGH